MRWRTTTTSRNPMSDQCRSRRPAANFARPALIEACARGSATATSKAGPKMIEAPQPRLRRNVPDKSATIRYHSGARARDHREPRDW